MVAFLLLRLLCSVLWALPTSASAALSERVALLLVLLQLLHDIGAVCEGEGRQIVPDRRALRHEGVVEDGLYAVGHASSVVVIAAAAVGVRPSQATIGIAQIVVEPVLVQQILSWRQRRRFPRQLAMALALLHLNEHLRAHLGIGERLRLVLGPLLLPRPIIIIVAIARRCCRGTGRLAHRLALRLVVGVACPTAHEIVRRNDATARMVQV